MKQKKTPNQTENQEKRKKKYSTQTQNIHSEIQGKSDLLRELYCRHAESVRAFPVKPNQSSPS